MTYNDLGARHYAWVEEMGWHNRSHLEAFGMIYSEVGEAAGEITPQGISNEFPLELADIVLRSVDEAIVLGLNIDFERQHYSPDRPAYRTIQACLLQMTTELGKGVNAARSNDVEGMATSLVRTLMLCEETASRSSIDLQAITESKMLANHGRGNRGRKI